MKTNELKTMIEAAEQLGEKNIRILKAEARDGNPVSYSEARFKLGKIGKDPNKETILIIT